MAGTFRFRRFQEEDAMIVASWRYPGPYSAYDLDPKDAKVVGALLQPDHNYHAILRDNEIIGYFCLGKDARVPGWDYDEKALDLGLGLRPDLTGQGEGRAYLEAVLSCIRQQRPGVALRATIASWNQRAIRLCRNAGFDVAGAFTTTRDDHTEFVVLVRSQV